MREREREREREKGKIETIEGIQLPNQENVRTLGEKENYRYLGILEANNFKQTKTKEKVRKEYLRRTRKHLESKFCSRYTIKVIHIQAVPLENNLDPF